MDGCLSSWCIIWYRVGILAGWWFHVIWLSILRTAFFELIHCIIFLSCWSIPHDLRTLSQFSKYWIGAGIIFKPQRKRPLKYYKNSGRNYTVLYWQLRWLVQMNGVANYTYWNYQQHWHMRLSSLHGIWVPCLLFCKWHFCGPVFALHLMWLQNECWGWVT